jgi:hypothetical protein
MGKLLSSRDKFEKMLNGRRPKTTQPGDSKHIDARTDEVESFCGFINLEKTVFVRS